MSGSNQATNLTGMLNQIGQQLGKERDISGLTRNIQNMSRPSGITEEEAKRREIEKAATPSSSSSPSPSPSPSPSSGGMFGGLMQSVGQAPVRGTDAYDQKLMNWQTKMGRTQEAAVTQAAMKQRQAQQLSKIEAAKTAGDNAFAKSVAIASANLQQAANSGDEGAYTQAMAEYNDVIRTAETEKQFDMVRANGTQVNQFTTNMQSGIDRRDQAAYGNVKKRQKALNQIPPERRTPQQVKELGQLENRLAELEAKNPKAVDKYYESLNTQLDAEGKQKAADIARGEEEAVAEGLKLLVEGKSGKDIQDELAEKYGSMATEAIAVITDALDAREKWGKKANEVAYVTAGAEGLRLEVAKLREAGDEASSNLADALEVSINLADSQKAGLPKTAVANIENAQNMLTAHLSGLALSKAKAENEVAADEASQANRARGQATEEHVDQAFDILEGLNASWLNGYDPLDDPTTLNVMASDLRLLELGLLEHTVFEWNGAGTAPIVRDGKMVTRSGMSVAEAAASARQWATQQTLNAANNRNVSREQSQEQSATTRRDRQDQANTPPVDDLTQAVRDAWNN